MNSKKWIWVVVIVVVIVLGFLTGFIVWVKSAHGFSASAQPTAMEAMMANMARRMALPNSAARMKNPEPATAANLTMARHHFSAHCAVCHNNNGDGLTDFGRNLYPKPPNLQSKDVQSLSDGDLFYMIRNGIRLSGMPAWPDDEDSEIWMLVTFIRHLPEQTPADIAEMKKFNPKTIFPEPIM